MSAAEAWAALVEPWRESFQLSWEAYAANTIPVGAVVVDADGRIVSRGRNRIFEPDGPRGELANTWLAHAEVNALATLPPERYPEHVLYTALEPCFLCLGATLMSTVGTLRFAAYDPVGAAAKYATQIEYATRRLVVEGPLDGPIAGLVPLLAGENILRRVPESVTAAKYRELAPELVANAEEARRRGVVELASAGGGLHECLALLWDLLRV